MVGAPGRHVSADALVAIVQAGARPLVVGIDGRTGAGKTSLAARLAATCDAAVVHMDWFYLPSDLRVPARLATPGGNVHAERFLAEVAPHLGTGDSFAVRPYSCRLQAYGEPIEVPGRAVTVVEGSYSLRPDLAPIFDLSVFVTCDPAVQRARLIAREGANAATYVSRWVPLEERYFAATAVEDRADYVVVTSGVR